MIPTLYHGSPFRLAELEPRVPRGETPFQTQKAVFLTSHKLEAQLYALARDPERKNKGWGIRNGVLRLRRDLWLGPEAKYHLNQTGYLHVFEGLTAVQQNPDVPTEWVSPIPVRPTRIEEVCLCDLPSQAIEYVDRLVGGTRKSKRTVRVLTRKQKSISLKMKHGVRFRFSIASYSRNALKRGIQRFVEEWNAKAQKDNAYIASSDGSLMTYTPLANLVHVEIMDNPIIRALSGTADVLVDLALKFEKHSQEKKALHRFEEDMKDWMKETAFSKPESYKDLLYANLLHDLSDRFRPYAEKELGLQYQTLTYFCL